jgi:hypothetical protein
MRSIVKVVALVVMLLALLVPLSAYASGGKCPDDPVASKNCNPDTPPYYVVINRDFEDLTRDGSGCQPFILNHPECEDCCTDNGWTADCLAAHDQVVDLVCPLAAEHTDWDTWPDDSVVLYVMCCDCNASADGEWRFTLYDVYEDGTCEPNPDNICILGLPPRTGIDLPAPVIAGGLAVLGAAMLGVGMIVRRRTTASV